MERHSGNPQGSPVVYSAEDLLVKMRAGIKEIYEIRLRDLVIPVRIISCDEVNAVRREAIRQTAIKQGDETDKNVEVQKTVLKIASTVTKGGAPLLGDKLLTLLSLDEITYLYDEYIKVMDVVNPSLETIPPDQFNLLVETLKKTLYWRKNYL